MLIPHQSLTVNAKHVFLGKLKTIFGIRKEHILNQWIPYEYKYWTSSGRDALATVLKNIKAKKVALPSFTCTSVLLSVKQAGATPLFIDSEAILDSKTIETKLKSVDALIVPYNYGFMPDMITISKLCKKHKVILIEDVAPALGAYYKNNVAGSFGNFAVYSFGISKGFFLGGMIGSHKPLNIEKKKSYPLGQIISSLTKATFNKIAFDPYFYPIFYKKLLKSLKSYSEPISYTLPRIAKAIDLEILKHYDRCLDLRRKNAELMMRELDGIIDFVKPIKHSNPSWLYFVFKVKDREHFRKALLNEKIDMIPLLEFQDLSKSSKKASKFEKQNLTFALHRPRWQIDYIINSIKKICKNGNY